MHPPFWTPRERPRRAHRSAEAQIVFRHFARVLSALVAPPRNPPSPPSGAPA